MPSRQEKYNHWNECDPVAFRDNASRLHMRKPVVTSCNGKPKIVLRICFPKADKAFRQRGQLSGKRTALYITGTDHNVTGFDTLRHLSQNSRIVGKVRIHLDNGVCSRFESLFKPFEISGSQSKLPRTMQNMNMPFMFPSTNLPAICPVPSGLLSSTTSTSQIQRKQKQSGDQFGQVLRFVIGWQNN